MSHITWMAPNTLFSIFLIHVLQELRLNIGKGCVAWLLHKLASAYNQATMAKLSIYVIPNLTSTTYYNPKRLSANDVITETQT